MKIRTGFVSNSSSSSFVLLGVKYDGDISEILDKYENLRNLEDTNIVGIHYFSADDYSIDDFKVSVEEIQKDFDTLKEIFGEDADIRWFAGMEYC